MTDRYQIRPASKLRRNQLQSILNCWLGREVIRVVAISSLSPFQASIPKDRK